MVPQGRKASNAGAAEIELHSLGPLKSSLGGGVGERERERKMIADDGGHVSVGQAT